MEHPPDHLLEVEGDEEYTEVHVDFGLAGVAEALVLHVVFHLPEDGLRFYRPAAAPEQTLLRGEQFAGMCLVAAQVVVDLHLAVAPALEAAGVQRAALAVGGAVDGDGVAVARGVGGEALAHAAHVLAGRADEVVPLFVVVHVLLTEWVFAEGAFLLLVEVAVLDVGCDAVGFHVVVVGLAAVTRVGGAGFGVGAGELFAVVEEGGQREGVGGVGVEGVVGDKLVLGPYLQVVARLELPVPHVVLLHVLEGGVVVGPGVGVALTHNLKVLLVLP